MKFSLFFELQISEPTPEKERAIFHEAVELITLADEISYDGVWFVEHHGLYEYAHSSAPEVILGYLAGKTRRIRLGHGVTLTPYRYNHPIRVAERIATLDILSEGRVNWGSGKSSSLVEQMAFEVDIPSLNEQWLEALRMIPRMWQEEVFSWKGKFFKIPPTQIIPKPVQKPHPPIFAACSKPDTAKFVGALGIGALNFAVGNDTTLGEKIREYREAVAQAEPQGYTKNNHFACTPATLVLDDDLKASRYGFRGARFFWESLGQYYFTGTRPLGKLPVPRDFLSDEELESLRRARNTSDSSLAAIVGDPLCARETVERFQRIGVDELLLVMQMGTVPHDLVRESVKTFGEKVIPHFR